MLSQIVGTSLWVAMVALGVCAIRLIPKVSNVLEPWLERIGALLFLGAGVVGATGWVGELLSFGFGVVRSQVVGAGVMWIIGLVITVAWILAFLPRKIVSMDYPDWLVIAGFFVPLLVREVPGPIGATLRSLVQLGGDSAVTAVRAAFGV